MSLFEDFKKMSVTNQSQMETDAAVEKAAGKATLKKAVKQRTEGSDGPSAPSGPLASPPPAPKPKMTEKDVKNAHRAMDAVDASKRAKACARLASIINTYVDVFPDQMRGLGVKKVAIGSTDETALQTILEQIRTYFNESQADRMLPAVLGSMVASSEYLVQATNSYAQLDIMPGALAALGKAIADGHAREELDPELGQLRAEYGSWVSVGLFPRLLYKLYGMTKQISSLQKKVAEAELDAVKAEPQL